MASVTALRARIAEIASDIIRQQQVLWDLVKTKSDLENHLNTILDPVTRLPLEISSEIFMHGLPHESIPHARQNYAPMIYLTVCRSWRDIALATPSLWSAIEVYGTREHASDLMDAWFTRAGSRPLTISAYANLSQDLVDVMHHHARRLQILKLAAPADMDRDDVSIDGAFCVKMLRVAPALIECTFADIRSSRRGSRVPDSDSPSTIPSLRHLKLGDYQAGYKGVTSDIVRYLTLPPLQSLSIATYDLIHEEFAAFLTRSSPPLQSLCLRLPNEGLSSAQIESLCQVMPTVTQLDLWYPKSPVSNGHRSDFIEALAEYSHHDLLPNLLTLTMRDFPFGPSQYPKLVVVLFSRRTQLRTFRFFTASSSYYLPLPEAGPLQELIADGMEILIGREDKNYI